MATPIVQFGTSRFLQAHVDLFLSESLAPKAGCGPVVVVQTTGDATRVGRVAAFDAGEFAVRLRGLDQGAAVDRTVLVRSVSRGLSAAANWREVERVFVEEATTVVSNTGDRGYELHAGDRYDDAVPISFPAKLAMLLAARYRAGGAPLDLYPCELISGNGDTLRRIVLSVATAWSFEPGLAEWIEHGCRWVNSLVDRIVSEPIEPLGAVAEPYALWAIEAQHGLVLPCAHADIVVTAHLAESERLKLLILNLGHTVLVELWRQRGAPAGMTVREALDDGAMRAALEAIYDDEVLPVFDALGMGAAALAYRQRTLERFANPFLRHFLADIATNHEAKRDRRFRPLIALALDHGVPVPRLSAFLS